MFSNDIAVGVDYEYRIVHLVCGRISLWVGQEYSQLMVFHQVKEAVHPRVGLREYPVGSNVLHEKITGDAQFRGNYPLGPLLGCDLNAIFHQLSILFNLAGDRS